jgi:hypothetical protein
VIFSSVVVKIGVHNDDMGHYSMDGSASSSGLPILKGAGIDGKIRYWSTFWINEESSTMIASIRQKGYFEQDKAGFIAYINCSAISTVILPINDVQRSNKPQHRLRSEAKKSGDRATIEGGAIASNVDMLVRDENGLGCVRHEEHGIQHI